MKTVYSSRVGADILIDDKHANGDRWITYRKFNSQGKVLEKITPSAIDLAGSSYDDTALDLNVQIKPNKGLIELMTWHSDSHMREFTME